MPILRKLGTLQPGIDEYRLDLDALYARGSEREGFEARWHQFLACSSEHSELFRKDGHAITYRTESFLPAVRDGRTPVLLLFGNPASQSVQAGMCFAFEGPGKREHRFWLALRRAGWLSFQDVGDSSGAEERNRRRRGQLLNAQFESPFLIGIDVYFTFPSPASAPRWSGVAGLNALFGAKAFRAIAAAEAARVAETVERYVVREGAVVAFQRDAYEGLRAVSAVGYRSAIARAGGLVSPTTGGLPIPLFGAPPTRLAHTRAFSEGLGHFRRRICSDGPVAAQSSGCV